MEFNTLVSGESDGALVAAAYDEDVVDPGGEGVALGVLEGNEIVVTGEGSDVIDDSDSSSVGTVVNVSEVADLHPVLVTELSGLNVKLDGVEDLDVLVSVTDGPAVVGNEVSGVVGTNGFLLAPDQLVLTLLLAEV